jgi:two-component system sensor histidine kinase DesK
MFPVAVIGLLAGSVLLLVPDWRRWAAYAAVVISWAALYTVTPLRGYSAADRGAFVTVYEGAVIALFGLSVYGLSRLAALARELEGLRGELNRMAAVRERLRVGRDVHDLLGLGLSAVALKADLIAALIGRDDARAAAEIGEMGRICAEAQADVRRVTGPGTRLSLAAEAAAAQQILASAGIAVTVDLPGQRLPDVADEVLAPVLREAVTNILRHSAATACTIEARASGGTLWLRVGNDGVGPPADSTGAGGGRGLPNLAARVRAAGGQFIAGAADGVFELTAQIPLGGSRRRPAGSSHRLDTGLA